MTKNIFRIILAAVLGSGAVHAQAPIKDLTGVYQAIPNATILPRGLRNSGSPKEITLTPAAARQ